MTEREKIVDDNSDEWCPFCYATGEIVNWVCPACSGSGFIKKKSTALLRDHPSHEATGDSDDPGQRGEGG